MRRRTLVTVAAVTLVVAAATTAFALWPNPRPGSDPARWPVETLVANRRASASYGLHVTPRDCPGFSLTSPVPADSRNVPGSGSYTVRLGGSHYTLWVCLGRTDEVGARRSVATHIGADEIPGSDGFIYNSHATRVVSTFGELIRVDRAFAPTDPPRLTDWVVDHGGYTYAFGYLHPTDDNGRWADVQAMVASVVWDQ